jgi:hypothetical protein
MYRNGGLGTYRAGPTLGLRDVFQKVGIASRDGGTGASRIRLIQHLSCGKGRLQWQAERSGTNPSQFGSLPQNPFSQRLNIQIRGYGDLFNHSSQRA